MSTKTSVSRVTNANIYLDGNSMLGQAEEVSLPELKAKMSPHRALGIVGDIETFSGFEKLEAKIKFNSYYPKVLIKLANMFKPVQIQARASMQVYEQGGVIREVPVVTLFTGTCKNYPLGNQKQHDNVELELQFNVLYVKQVIDGQTVLEYDVLANIYKVNGVDLLAQYRANTGA